MMHPKAGAGRLVLGTAQLGLSYGIANTTGQPDRTAALNLLQAAAEAGVRCLDTAACYGESEAVLGSFLAGESSSPLHVVTKVDTPLEDAAATLSAAELGDMVRQGVARSCQRLGQKRLDTVLIREAWPLRGKTAFWDALRDLQDSGVIGRLGLSAQAPEDVPLALACPHVQHLQIPINLLDYRWREAGVLQALAARPDVTVHARSVYLQGLLTAGPGVVWPQVAEDCGAGVGRALEAAVAALGRRSVADLCVAYVLGLPGVDAVVLGVETLDQLRDNLEIVNQPPLTMAERAQVDALMPHVPEALLNPALW